VEGEAWRGVRRDDRPAARLVPPPAPYRGGVAEGEPGVRVERRGPSTTGVSRELTTGVSRELSTGVSREIHLTWLLLPKGKVPVTVT
jgi:hypothetical protein